jgi:PleD family two-component response regulator
MHDGTVAATSKDLGHGGTVTLRLPLASGSASERSFDPKATIVKRRVLIVDDNHDAADSLSILLQMEGHEVSVAYSGEELISHWPFRGMPA